jgi:hypothetical protein
MIASIYPSENCIDSHIMHLTLVKQIKSTANRKLLKKNMELDPITLASGAAMTLSVAHGTLLRHTATNGPSMDLQSEPCNSAEGPW